MSAPDREPPTPTAVGLHFERKQRFEERAATLDARADRISLLRLLLFLGVVVFGVAGLMGTRVAFLAAAGACAIAFIASVVQHARVLRERDRAKVRADVHARHVLRLTGRFHELSSNGAHLAPARHAYASDIDLFGPGSLFQRIDVTHTHRGERTLAEWLLAGASPEVIAARQIAVRELADNVELRQELEALALERGEDKLDDSPFARFVAHAPYLLARPALAATRWVLPLLTLGVWIATPILSLPKWAWLLPLVGNVIVLFTTRAAVHRAFDLAVARRGFAEAFSGMLGLVESTKMEAPLLREIAARTHSAGLPPSAQMKKLDLWAGFAEVRQQFPLHLVLNTFFLWDLHVLVGLERWNRDAGTDTARWFEAIGEIEALACLATFAHGQTGISYPQIVPSGETLDAEGLAHPLLPPNERVTNDLPSLAESSALIVTGSNMAGKSTLLRALGANVVLAFAGGPVCATFMRVPILRLRASMRAEDSLQRGASYFHAELEKLRGVVEGADDAPPILFILDELLRGTNAVARHVGSRAVVQHLLKRHGRGLVATHDIALAKLEEEQPTVVRNAHFTDVVDKGVMRFDYRLRPGPVRTSNALRLLRMAGIDVPEDAEAHAIEENVT